MEIAIAGALWGFLLGLLLGAIPMFTGMFKEQLQLGIIALFSSGVAGAILGLILALPVSGYFVWLIVKKDKESQKEKI